MAEAEVRRYLDSRHLEYYPVRIGGSDGPTYEIKIGEENDLICEWDVYIASEFSSTDALTQIHIKKGEPACDVVDRLEARVRELRTES